MKEKKSFVVKNLAGLSDLREESNIKRILLVEEAKFLNQNNYDEGWKKDAIRRMDEFENVDKNIESVVEIKPRFFDLHKKKIAKAAVVLFTAAGAAGVVEVQAFEADSPSQVGLTSFLTENNLIIADADVVMGEDYTAARLIESLGMLKGGGEGVTEEYLKTSPSRLQAAIMDLRLKGLEETALAYKGTTNFADAKDVGWSGGRAILGYLKTHPDLGWVGDGVGFKPNNLVDAKQYYKVLLGNLGYKQGVDFTWEKVQTFAESKGLGIAFDYDKFTVNVLAKATVEALNTKMKGSGMTLLEKIKYNPAVEMAKPYVAGSEFWEGAVPYKISVGSTGVVRIYSTKEINATEKALFDKAEKKCSKNDVLCVAGGETFVLNKQDPLSVRKINSQGEIKDYRYQTNNPWNNYKINWNKESGICLTDELRITHKFNPTTGKFIELKDYKMLGTPEQRFNHDLKKLMYEDESVGEDGKKYKNPLGLSETEVKKYLETGSDAGFQSFEVAKDAEGKPAFVIALGGKYGLKNEFGNTAERLNEIDDKLIRYLVDQCFLRFVSRDMAPGGYFSGYKKDYASAPDWLSGVMINETNYLGSIKLYENMEILLNEGRGLYYNHHMEYLNGKWIGVGDYLLSEDGEREKSLWTIQKLEGYIKQNFITKGESDYFKMICESLKDHWNLW